MVETWEPMRICLRCSHRYHWQRSTSLSLKMTFCSFLCEKAYNGTTIEDILAVTHIPWSELLKEVAV